MMAGTWSINLCSEWGNMFGWLKAMALKTLIPVAGIHREQGRNKRGVVRLSWVCALPVSKAIVSFIM